jgi:hypothetical protein
MCFVARVLDIVFSKRFAAQDFVTNPYVISPYWLRQVFVRLWADETHLIAPHMIMIKDKMNE